MIVRNMTGEPMKKNTVFKGTPIGGAPLNLDVGRHKPRMSPPFHSAWSPQ